jgi:hypothetical protein
MLRRCLLVVLFASTPLRAAVVVGPEVAISNPPYAAAAGNVRAVSIGSSGTDFLVVWIDATPGREGLYATRITALGQVTTGSGFSIRSGRVADVSVSWTGYAYVVAWTDARAHGVMMASIDATATIRLILPRLLAGPVRTFRGALAWNGSRGLLACDWGGGDIHGTLIDENGRVLIPDTGALIVTQYGSVHVLGHEPTFTLFALVNVVPFPNGPLQPAIVARRISDLGRPMDVEPATIGLASNDFAVAAGGDGWAAVTVVMDAAGRAELRRYRGDLSLHTSEMPPIPVKTDSAGVAWKGGVFEGYWIDSDVRAFEFRTVAFEQSEARTITMGSSAATDPVLAWNGSQSLAVWTNGPDSTHNNAGGDVAAVLIAADGASFPQSIAVSTAPGWQSAPRIAHAGHASLVVWTEKVSDEVSNQVGVRIDRNGQWLDPAPFVIAERAGTASVVAVSSGFLVAYLQDSLIYVRRIADDGTLGEPARIGSGYAMTAGSNGRMALIAFFSTQGALNGVRVDDTGTILDHVPLVITAGIGVPTCVASDGTDFLVVANYGSDFAPGGIPFPDLVNVYATRVFASGAVDVPIAVATGPKNQKDGVAASDGRDYVIAYFTQDVATPQRWLATKRILREGQLANGTPSDDGHIIDAASWYDTASIVPSASGYMIAWETASNTSSVLHLIRTDRDGARAGVDVVVAESESPYFQMLPSMTPLDSAVQLAYGRFGPPMRVFTRLAADAEKRRSVGRKP